MEALADSTSSDRAGPTIGMSELFVKAIGGSVSVKELEADGLAGTLCASLLDTTTLEVAATAAATIGCIGSAD